MHANSKELHSHPAGRVGGTVKSLAILAPEHSHYS